MAKVSMAELFIAAAARLPKETRAKLPKVFDLIRTNPRHPSLQVKKLEGAIRRNVYECRLNDSFRIILELESDMSYGLVYVGSHDEALRYGTRVAEPLRGYGDYVDLREELLAYLYGDEAAITFRPLTQEDVERLSN